MPLENLKRGRDRLDAGRLGSILSVSLSLVLLQEALQTLLFAPRGMRCDKPNRLSPFVPIRARDCVEAGRKGL
ncbi:MAG: hypothetical protein A2098_00375 [Chlamydiae bacterium GWF2_49_8]|nr:MAG: hypothetical protein A2098_00375 [Chlamydiae bacterium GWF2_49_8]